MLKFFRRLFMVQKTAGKLHTPGNRYPRAKLQVNALEDRVVPAVFNVNSTADILDPGPGIVTLRSAIEAANATPGGNTINLTVPGTYAITLPGTPGESDNAAGEFAISAAGGNLTIDNTSGGQVTVNGNHLARVFDINTVFTVGSATVIDGGSGFTSAPTVTISGGGGTGATATATIANGQVAAVTITSPGTGYTSPPTISFSGGGGSGAAAVAIMASPKIAATMSGFTITDGFAQGGGVSGSGGAIRDTNNASLILNNMVINDNLATGDGGGIVMEDVLNTPWLLSMTNTTVTDNIAFGSGGGVVEDGTGRIIITGGTIANNTSGFEGGGFLMSAVHEGGVFSVSVLNGGSGYTSAPMVTFSGGGGTGATGTAVIANGRVVAVMVTNPGTGYIAAPTITLSGGTTRKTATATATLDATTGTTNVTGVDIRDNTSLFSVGGGITNEGDGALTIANSTIARNFALKAGGGFSDQNNQGTLTVSNSLFQGNETFGDGGGIFVGSPTTTITNSQIEGNTGLEDGGGVFAGGIKLTMQSSTIANNFTSGNGGGIQLETSGQGPTNGSSIIDSTITGNRALGAGGGIGTSAAFTGSLSLENDTINANTAAIGGGVASLGSSGSSITVQNTILAANSETIFPGIGKDAFGTFTDGGGNLIGISGALGGNSGFTASTTQTGSFFSPLDPLLEPLADNGGPTVGAAGNSILLETEALKSDSPAIGAGVAGGAGVDERGFPVATPTPDDGAFQFQDATLGVTVAASSATVTTGGSVSFTITVSNTSGKALPNDNTMVIVVLPLNFTITSVPPGAVVTGNMITFSLGALAAGAETQFTVMATADTAGNNLTIAVAATSPDTDPNTTTGSTQVSIT